MVTIKSRKDLPNISPQIVTDNMTVVISLLQQSQKKAKTGEITPKQLAQECEQAAGILADTAAILKKA